MLLYLLAAVAAGPFDDEVAQACIDKSRTQSEMNLCANEEWKRADAALNAEYKSLIARMKTEENFSSTEDGRPNGETLLRDSQRSWVAMRDRFCLLDAYNNRGGSLEPMTFDRCMAEITRERTEWLQRIAAPLDGPGE